MPRGRAVPDMDKQDMVRMFVQGMEPADIAVELELSTSTVYRTLGELGYKLNEEEDSPLTPQSEQKVLEDYMSLKPVAQICAEAGINHSYLYKLVSKAGLKLRSETNGNDMEDRLETAINMYIDGRPYYEINSFTKISSFKLNQEIHSRGIPLRRPRNAPTSMQMQEQKVLPSQADPVLSADGQA
jgi:transposase-like protein